MQENNVNNQTANNCCEESVNNKAGGINCPCPICQKWGTCPLWKWHRIIKWAIIVIVVLFIIKIIFGGDRNWRDNDRIVNTITVSGQGEIVVKPDIANVSFGVTAENLDVTKAQTESATKINNIIALLKNNGVEEKDIKTTNYNIYPRYDYLQAQIYPYTGRQSLAAYVVSQTVEIKIRDISKSGEILSGIGGLGVTDVSGLTFTVDEQDEVKDQARDLAIKDAKDQAKVLAESLDVRLVKIISFSENGNYPMYYAMEKSAVMGMGGADAVVPRLPSGENKITSTVSITYEIK